jgi:uridine phosphorylase
VLASEMEAAAIFTVAAVRNVRAGAVLAVINVAPLETDMPDPTRIPLDDLVPVAVDGIRRLIASR